MLLDIGSVLGGIGLAVFGFIVVVLVCVVILRLLAAILPSYEDRDRQPSEPESAPEADGESDDDAPSEGVAEAATEADRVE